MEPYEPPTIGGLEIEHWFEAWTYCHNAQGQHAWPAGGSYVEQDNLVIVMFGLIAQEYMVWLRQQKQRRH
jgi:hypothetical protein